MVLLVMLLSKFETFVNQVNIILRGAKA